ncbi:MAG TPA: ATP-binding protein [Thermoanaerobaculia bacterium]
MRLLQDLPIRQKLMVIALLTTGGALLLAGTSLILIERSSLHTEMAEDLETLAAVMAGNSDAMLLFQDKTAARDLLASLEPQVNVVAAALYDSRGGLFATWRRQGRQDDFPARPEVAVTEYRDGALITFQPVHDPQTREVIGTVFLRSGLGGMNRRLWLQALTVGTVFIASGLAALLLASTLQRVISRPILDLSAIARRVSEVRDYSLRAEKRSPDELGQLVDSFNEMLGQIQQRDLDLQRAKEGLEQRVRERTRELRQELAERLRAEQELEVRNEELHQSNKELDDFAYIASHDLKEPLRGIHNFSNFLLEDYGDKLDDEGRAKLETLTRLSRRMETLIDSLLHFSRLGRVDLAIDQVDLNRTVEEIIDSLAISLKAEGIQVRVPKPLPTVRADRARVGEIFYNLIVNAMRYNDKPEKRIEIGTVDGAAPPVFYVRDNGIGIPEKHHDAVFRIFKRLHGRDKYGGGTGAGLTIVKKIVERHHGRIWLESVPGEGTTFYFTLEEGDPSA